MELDNSSRHIPPSLQTHRGPQTNPNISDLLETITTVLVLVGDKLPACRDFREKAAEAELSRDL